MFPYPEKSLLSLDAVQKGPSFGEQNFYVGFHKLWNLGEFVAMCGKPLKLLEEKKTWAYGAGSGLNVSRISISHPL